MWLLWLAHLTQPCIKSTDVPSQISSKYGFLKKSRWSRSSYSIARFNFLEMIRNGFGTSYRPFVLKSPSFKASNSSFTEADFGADFFRASERARLAIAWSAD